MAVGFLSHCQIHAINDQDLKQKSTEEEDIAFAKVPCSRQCEIANVRISPVGEAKPVDDRFSPLQGAPKLQNP